MIYKYKNKIVEIEMNVLDVFSSFKQVNRKPENGGILLGILEEDRILITRASIPTSLDSKSRYRFTRNKKSAQIIIDYEFINSDGSVIYLGEWHTHPENFPSPSQTDLRMIQKQYEKNVINEPFLFMIIIGLQNIFVGVYDDKGFHELKKQA